MERALQWSHALTRVETWRPVGQSSRVGIASMEPRTHARGNDAKGKLYVWGRIPSMEPRTHARGNP